MAFFLLNSNSSSFFNLVRLLAANLVVVGHITSWIGLWPITQPPHFPFIQGVGVVVFFLLSGFLIPYSTALKLKENSAYSLKDFFIERFARIYVSLIPCLIFVFILDSIQIYINVKSYDYLEAFNFKTFLGNILMLEDAPPLVQNYFISVTSFGSARTLWTLAIEWWIYFWFGYLYIVFYKNKRQGFLNLLLLLLFSIVPFFNFIYGRGPSLMLPWLMGIVMLLSLPYFVGLNLNWYISIFILFVLTGMMYLQYKSTHFHYVEPYYVVILTLFFLISLSKFHNSELPAIFKKIFQLGADYSFTLYLIHYSIIDFLLKNVGNRIPKIHFLIIAFVSSNIISYFLAKYTEMKYRSFRNFIKIRLVKLNKA
jgi:peptidoglycan/LPS O-acetylase OafA/YrhL